MALDQELIAYFDERFRETQQLVKQEVQGLREETAEQLQVIREEAATFREETRQRFDRVEEAIEDNIEATRHNGVLIEGLESKVQLVAEGVAANTERLDAFRTDVDERYENLSRRVLHLETVAASKVRRKR